MAIAEVASQKTSAFSSVAVDSLALAFPNPVTAGHLLLVCGAGWKSNGKGGAYSGVVVTDSLGTTYTVVLGGTLSWASGQGRGWIAYGIAQGSGACTVTVNPTGGNGVLVIAVDGFSGVDVTAPLDVDGGGSTGNGSAPSDGVTTVAAGDLVVGQLVIPTGAAGLTVGSGYTAIYGTHLNNGHPGGAEFKIAGAGGAQTVDWTYSGTTNWVVHTLAFKPSTGAQSRVVTLARGTDTPLAVTIPAFRRLGLVSSTDTPLPVGLLQGAAPDVATFLDPFTASDGLLGTTSAAVYTHLEGGTRWRILSNQAAFVGSAFGGESLRCNLPADSETYAVRVTLASFSRGGANDVSLGVIVRKDATSAMTFYTAFVNATASATLVQLWRYLNGTATQLQTAPAVAVAGQLLEVQVIPRTFPTTGLIVRLGGVPYLNVNDDAIPSGRYFGLHGYLQGTLAPDPVLRLDTLQMQVPQFLQRRRRGLMGFGGLSGLR